MRSRQTEARRKLETARAMRLEMQAQEKRREKAGWPRAVSGPYRPEGATGARPAILHLATTRPPAWALAIAGAVLLAAGYLLGAMQ